MKLNPRLPRPLLAIMPVLLASATGLAVDIEGFTEPYRTVEVASSEQGILQRIDVDAGAVVKKGDIVAMLDNEVHVTRLRSAEEQIKAKGRLNTAEAEVRLRKLRLKKLRELDDRGFGRKQEIDRAFADLEVAEAQLLTVSDELKSKHWNYLQSKVELKRRAIKSPIDGVVVTRLKEVGEFVAPNEPNVITVVQLNPLLAKFSLKRSMAGRVRRNQELYVTFPVSRKKVKGIVEKVSPVIDAQSGTLRIKVRVDNSEGYFLAGERCTLHIPINDDYVEGQLRQTNVKRDH